jgi:hypothetical protein
LCSFKVISWAILLIISEFTEAKLDASQVAILFQVLIPTWVSVEHFNGIAGPSFRDQLARNFNDLLRSPVAQFVKIVLREALVEQTTQFGRCLKVTVHVVADIEQGDYDRVTIQ